MHSASIRNFINRLLGRTPAALAAQYRERGNALCAGGRHAEGIAAFEQAIAADPHDAESHYRCGLAWRDMENLDAAIASYGRALQCRPDFTEAHNNLGVALQLQNRLEDACAAYRRAVALRPQFSQPYMNLGRLCELMGARDEAIQSYRAAIAANVEPDTFTHFLNAAQGVITGRAPAAYAKTVFDNFAEHFDSRLVEDLGYRVPQILCDCIAGLMMSRTLRVLDLGCGTGLCGLRMRNAAAQLVGVDVSPAMLAKAKQHEIYDQLLEQDISEYLATARDESFDVVIAADVFVYIGDLREVFGEVARVLAPGGVFAFSIERLEQPGDYFLQPNGRYLQSVAYVRSLAESNDFSETSSFEEVIRTGAPGQLFLLRKSA